MRIPLKPITAAMMLLVPFCALAQYSVDKIVFRGGASYTDVELNSVAGLDTGEFLAHDSLAAATQHLLDTGLFDDAEVSLIGQDKARTVVFVLKPTPIAKLLPASFENFVWFTPADLDANLRARLPLYRGAASDAGTFADSIQTALQQMLAAKGVTATLSHSVVEPTTQHPQRVVNFMVEVPVRIGKVTLTVSSGMLAAQFSAVSASASGQLYNEGLSGVTFVDLVLAPARNAGCLSAKLDDLHRSFSTTANGVSVDIAASLNPGDPYKVASIAWTATPVYSTADFDRDNKLHPGDLAAANLLAGTEARIIAAYRSQGHLDAYLDSSPALDPGNHTVAYFLHAIPGQPYRLHSVTAQGLSPDAQQEFDRGWLMKPGDLYNESYVANFLHNNTALQRLNGYSAGFQASADPQTHLVDLTITFVRASGAQ